MPRSTVLLLTFVAALAAGGLGAATPLDRLAGADTTVLVTINDLGTLQKNWQLSPFSKTWNDPQMIKFLAPLREALQIEDWDNRCRAKVGKSVDELVAGFGSMVLVVADLSAAVEDPAQKTPPGVLLAVDLRDNRDALVKLIEEERQKSQQTEVTEEFQGETLHLETPANAKEGGTPVCWVIVGRVLLAGPGKPIVQKAVADYKRGGTESPFVETDRYRGEVRRLPDAQIRFHVDMERVMAAVQAAAARDAAKQKPNPQGMTPDVVIKALGLDTLRVISLACRIGDKDCTMIGSVTYDQPRGITRFFSAAGDGPVPELSFLSGDWASVSAARFRIGVLYDIVEEITRGFGPAIDQMFQTQVGDLNKRAGIDLKRDVFENFGDELYSAAQFDPPDASAESSGPKQRQLLVFSLKDAKAFEAALQGLQTGLMGPAAAQMFQTRDYLGTSIHSMVKPVAPGAAPAPIAPAAPVFSYAVTQRHWVLGIGGEDLVEMAIQNLNSPQPSYWSRPAVKAALEKLPAGAAGYGYTDMHKLAPTYFELFVQGMLRGPWRVKDGHFVNAPPVPPRPPGPRTAKGGPSAPPAAGAPPPLPPAPPADPGHPIVDMSAKPSADTIAQYWGAVTSASYHDEGGVHTVIRLEYPQ